MGMQGEKSLFDPSAYKELYHLKGNKRSIVMDVQSMRMCVRKLLDVYNPDVFVWLKEHHHPNLANVLGFEMREGKLAVLEEFIEGNTLEKELEDGNLSEEEKLSVLCDVLSAADFLHNADPAIIHRDIKPSNIILDKEKRAYLADYDAAKIYHPEESRDTVLIGTQGSAAPEQYGFKSSDQRTDIYALGMLMKELFPGEAWAEPIIEKATKMDPEDRYANVKLMADQLRRRKSIPSFRSSSRKTVNIPGFRTGKPWKAIAALLCYIALFLIWYFAQIRGDDGVLISGPVLIGYKVMMALIIFSEIDLFTDWTHFFKKSFPWLSAEKLSVRIIAYIVIGAMTAFFWMLLLAFLLPWLR